MALTEVTDANFTDLSGGDKVLIVDFWAEWCGPCKMLSPVFEELAGEMSDQATFGKLNVDENQGVAGQFGVVSIPAVIAFKDGAELGRHVGFAPKNVLKEFVARSVEQAS